MTSPPAPAPSPRQSAGVRRPSLSAAVVRLTAVALVATVLIWSAMFVDLLGKRGERTGALTQRTGQNSGSDGSQAPAPVTTRSS